MTLNDAQIICDAAETRYLELCDEYEMALEKYNIVKHELDKVDATLKRVTYVMDQTNATLHNAKNDVIDLLRYRDHNKAG